MTARRIAASTVSTRHARFDYDGTTVTLSDLGSTNGTFVNETPLGGSIAIEPGDQIRCGNAVVVLMLLSGGSTPVESQPKWLQYVTYFLPARHFVSFSQIIIYRGGGFGAVWLQFLMVGAIGLGFFVYSLALFRKSIAVTK